MLKCLQRGLQRPKVSIPNGVRTKPVASLSNFHTVSQNSIVQKQWNCTLKFNSSPTRGFIARGYATLPSHEEMGMPALSPTMDKGNIAV
jgi:hypothetical protein